MHERPRSAQHTAWDEPALSVELTQAWARHGNEGVVALDARASVKFANARALALLGLSPQAAESELAHALFRLLPAAPPRPECPASHVAELEVEHQKRWLRVTRLRVPAADGRGASSELVLLDDVSALKSAEEQIGRLSAELSRRAVERVEHSQTIRELEELALRDPLTGLLNRRAFQERLAEEVARAQRYSSDLSLLLVDIDHFKRINDTYGHTTGDVAIAHVASVLGEARRSSDIVARYGGEEFAVIAPHTSREGARTLGERLCCAMRERPYRTRSVTEAVRVSVGVATLSVRVDDASELLFEAADRALYTAKRGGRDRVAIAEL